MAFTLTPRKQSLIAAASRVPIVDALARLRKSSPTRWLPTEHAYRDGAAPLPRPRPSKHASVVELIAASGPNHCIDGWGFVARAFQALAAGDPHSVRHFAYYAQLRAALAILAANGLGVFNRWNCAVTHGGTLSPLEMVGERPFGTHVMAWLALEAWADLPSAGALVGKSLAVRSVPFNDALALMWPGVSTRPLMRDIVLAWGIDLARSLDERQARNSSSYDPQALTQLVSDPEKTLDFLDAFWGLFEPDGIDPFPELDRYLFRLTVETQYKAMTGQTSGSSADLARRYPNLPPAVQSAISLNFLTRVNAAEAPLLVEAGKRSPVATATEMIARAVLLLRAAIAVISTLLFDAGYSRSSGLRFWSEAYGHCRGFWSGLSGPPTPISELWLDVQAALEEVSAVRQSASSPLEQATWASAIANGLPRLCEAERIALWGLSE